MVNIKNWLRRRRGYKQIRCVMCKKQVWVKNDHPFLKRCPACQTTSKHLVEEIKEALNLGGFD